MFSTSSLLLLEAIGINIFVPLIAGILFLWIFFGTWIRGMALYSIAFFIGTGVVAYSLFNLQFLYFGVGMMEYLVLVVILSCILIAKLYFRKEKFRDYWNTLRISFSEKMLFGAFRESSFIQKIIIIWWSFFVISFSVVGFVFASHFPTYADDSFGNWNKPAINIYYDGWVEIFGTAEERLGRWREGYPIFMPIYKALISDSLGSFNDIYINFWQYFGFLFFLIFIVSVTFERTQNLLLSLLPAILVTGLPLIFFHSVEWYYDLACALYSVFTVYFLYRFLEEWDEKNLLLAFLFGCILTNIKNDGLVVYFIGIFLAFFVIVLLRKQAISFFRSVLTQKKILFSLLGSIIWFIAPAMFLKYYYGLWFNQAAGQTTGIGLSDTIHSEIFSVFPTIFFWEDNYNIALVFVVFLLFVPFWKKRTDIYPKLFLVLASIFVFCILIAVFLFTENYLWVMNQTTVNRVFTMVFVLLFSFSGILLYDKNHKKGSLL